MDFKCWILCLLKPVGTHFSFQMNLDQPLNQKNPASSLSSKQISANSLQSQKQVSTVCAMVKQTCHEFPEDHVHRTRNGFREAY